MLVNIVKTILFVILTILNLASYATTKNVIYLYSDEGASKDSLKHTISTLKNITHKAYIIKMINSNAVKEKVWTQDAALFVMPGGADLPYARKLNGQGNQIIQDYVNNGGSYLGICAGSYYAADFIEFDKGGALEVIGERELKFFPGIAKGPAIAKYDYTTNSGARAADINITMKDYKKNIKLFFNGGSYFENASSFPNVTVLSWYQLPQNKLLPSILHIKVGKGNVVLSGVHFEYDPFLFDTNDIYLVKLTKYLTENSIERKIFILKILKLLGLKNI